MIKAIKMECKITHYIVVKIVCHVFFDQARLSKEGGEVGWYGRQ